MAMLLDANRAFKENWKIPVGEKYENKKKNEFSMFSLTCRKVLAVAKVVKETKFWQALGLRD